jgi:hypothetical protein
MTYVNKARLDDIRREIAELAKQDEQYSLQRRTTQIQRNDHARRLLRLQELKAELAAMKPEMPPTSH